MKVSIVDVMNHNGRGEKLFVYLDGRLTGTLPRGSFGDVKASELCRLIGVDFELVGTYAPEFGEIIPRESLADALEDVYRRRRASAEKTLKEAQDALVRLDKEFGKS